MIWPFRRRELQPLDRLEQGVLDNATPLADLLRTALVMGGHASSEPLRTWARSELLGYGGLPESAVPDYRRIKAPMKADTHTAFNRYQGQTISALHLPKVARGKITEDIDIYFGVAQLEHLVAETPPGSPVRVQLHGAAELMALMSASDKFRRSGTVIDALYWAVSPFVLQDIVDQVRTRLTEFVAALRATMPAGSRGPTPEQVARVVQHIIINTGDHSPVTLTAPMAYAESGSTAAATVGTTVLRRWWPRSR
ncbi:hypothetical protein [Streptomyces sp. NRRL S-237]|uniref:AbiTii domain-containing protein n=1 Tax=Streptomyces sp. NRRL S-237 TaxID=1463895 RepID=UPI0004C7A2DC|nr:hypothetical protein [Streptomyces sp. NRRL S-237]